MLWWLFLLTANWTASSQPSHKLKMPCFFGGILTAQLNCGRRSTSPVETSIAWSSAFVCGVAKQALPALWSWRNLKLLSFKKKKKKVHQCYVTSSSKNYKSKTFVQVAAILNWWCFVLFKQSWSDHASELFPFFFFLPGVDHIVLHSLSFLLCLVAHINSTACYNKCNLVTKKPDFISAYTRWWLFCHRRIVLS